MERFIEYNKKGKDGKLKKQYVLLINSFIHENNWSFSVERTEQAITFSYFKRVIIFTWTSTVFNNEDERRDTLLRQIDRRKWFPVLRIMK